VNLVLFDPAETRQPLPRSDPRAEHILRVLRRKAGDRFDAGLVNGPRGKAMLVDVSPQALELRFDWGPSPAADPPLTLLVGLSRPQTARDILRDATTLGATAIHFVRTEKSEASYADSTLWSSGEWRRHLLTGAAQAFATAIPDVTHTHTLEAALAGLPESTRLALDNYEATRRLGEVELPAALPPVVAIGGERGWSARDRDLLRAHHFTLAHLGPRVLRTETAVIAALTVIRSRRGLM
jgi:RsmE family RNA methyltransferase